MKSLCQGLLNRYLSVETRSTRQQFEMDFGVFPPAPLNCAVGGDEWAILRVRGIGKPLQEFRQLRAMVRAAQQNDQRMDREISNSDYFTSLQRSLKAFENFPRLTNVLISGASVLLAVRSFCRQIHRPGIHPGPSGHFSQYSPDEIVVYNESSGSLDVEATISHEHIHLLQYRDHEVCNRYLSDPQSFLSDAALRFGQFEYFFERREVEARFHEILICAYRAGNELPTTLLDLFRLLTRCQHLGEPISDILGLDPEELDEPAIPCRAGGEAVFKQFGMAMMAFRTGDLAFGFVTEVLPVMYANLIRYYGDGLLSEKIMSQVQRPNLYDELYSPVLDQARVTVF